MGSSNRLAKDLRTEEARLLEAVALVLPLLLPVKVFKREDARLPLLPAPPNRSEAGLNADDVDVSPLCVVVAVLLERRACNKPSDDEEAPPSSLLLLPPPPH